MRMKQILIVDDDRASCNLLRELFISKGWRAQTSQSPQGALKAITLDSYDLLLIDINLGDAMSGIDLLRELRGRCPIIIMTGYGTLDATVAAAREGAWDIISKPFKPEELVSIVERAINRKTNTIENDQHATLPEENVGMLGRSPVMLNLYKEIARVAPSRSTILITGESGTGKELVARSLHHHSARAKGPFVPVNCGALTETLLEAELFGHVRGAFTGAISDRKGLWEEAEGGTLFLDEIGETTPAMQVRLLRALQEKEIRRVGSTRNTPVDARVIAATNRQLEAEVEARSFREDLYYRLCVVTLKVPSLRERRSDIPLLATRFLNNAAENAGNPRLRLSSRTIEVLTSYDWPGNVRELESAIEYGALHARGDEITEDDLPSRLQSVEIRETTLPSPLTALYDDLPMLEELERRYLLHVLEVVNGSRTKAATILGIDRRTLYRMAERFRIGLKESDPY